MRFGISAKMADLKRKSKAMSLDSPMDKSHVTIIGQANQAGQPHEKNQIINKKKIMLKNNHAVYKIQIESKPCKLFKN